MRILILSSKGRGTGCILRARSIARAFEKLGHKATVLPPFPTLPLWLDMAFDKVWYFLAGLFVRADVAIGIKPYPTLVPALWWQKWVHKAKVVLDVDDLDYAYSGGWFRSLHKALQLPWPRRADHVTYHNPLLLKPLREDFRVPEEKLLSLPQGVETEWFREFLPTLSDLPRQAAHLLGTRPSPLLVFTAHLNSACSLKEVLEAFRQILEEKPEAHLLVAGGGPEDYLFWEEAQRKGVADRVTFTGMLTQRQVAACLNLADLALVYYGPGPANEHRASMKLREALACGIRIVATDVGEMRRFKRHVFLSPPDPAAFARTALQALAGRPKPALPKKAVQALNWGSCIQALERKVSTP